MSWHEEFHPLLEVAAKHREEVKGLFRSILAEQTEPITQSSLLELMREAQPMLHHSDDYYLSILQALRMGGEVEIDMSSHVDILISLRPAEQTLTR